MNQRTWSDGNSNWQCFRISLIVKVLVHSKTHQVILKYKQFTTHEKIRETLLQDHEQVTAYVTGFS